MHTSFHSKFILLQYNDFKCTNAAHNCAVEVGGGASLFSLMPRLLSMSRPLVMAATSSQVDSKLQDKIRPSIPTKSFHRH